MSFLPCVFILPLGTITLHSFYSIQTQTCLGELEFLSNADTILTTRERIIALRPPPAVVAYAEGLLARAVLEAASVGDRRFRHCVRSSLCLLPLARISLCISVKYIYFGIYFGLFFGLDLC